MPPRGIRASSKRARQYEHIRDSEQGESKSSAEQIPAPTVNKAHARPGDSRTSSPTPTEDMPSSRRSGLRSGANGRKDELVISFMRRLAGSASTAARR
jgi:hypothetical protein